MSKREKGLAPYIYTAHKTDGGHLILHDASTCNSGYLLTIATGITTHVMEGMGSDGGHWHVNRSTTMHNKIVSWFTQHSGFAAL